MSQLTLGLLLSTLCGLGCRGPAVSLPFEISLSEGGNLVTIRGRWVSDTPLPGPLMAKLNSATIECRQQEMKCHESTARLVTQEDEPRLDHEFLSAGLATFEVVEWSATEIRAVEHAPVADISLRIVLPNGPVTRTHQEVATAAHSPSNPSFKASWDLR